jgi:hypothetical protein
VVELHGAYVQKLQRSRVATSCSNAVVMLSATLGVTTDFLLTGKDRPRST